MGFSPHDSGCVFWPIQNEIPRDDGHTAQHESLEWESPLFLRHLGFYDRIPSAYFKAGTEKNKKVNGKLRNRPLVSAIEHAKPRHARLWFREYLPFAFSAMV
jgi:hypothetical protein